MAPLKLHYTGLDPAARYKVKAVYGGTVQLTANDKVEIHPLLNKPYQVVEFDLPASRLVYLYRKPAPELKKIKAWKNTQSLQLADLRREANQVARDERRPRSVLVFEDERFGEQVIVNTLVRLVARGIARHEHRLRRRDLHAGQANLSFGVLSRERRAAQ